MYIYIPYSVDRDRRDRRDLALPYPAMHIHATPKLQRNSLPLPLPSPPIPPPLLPPRTTEQTTSKTRPHPADNKHKSRNSS